MKTVGAYQAKTHLPRLLEQVAGGEEVTITKHGHPVAKLAPVAKPAKKQAAQAIAGLRLFQSRHSLGGLKLRRMLEEGRRF